jgi:hypothetical protein
MSLSRLTHRSAFCCAFSFATFASVAGAQNQTWVRQFGSSSWDFAYGAATDGSGGVYVTGVTFGSLGGPSAGGDDAWLARYDGAGNPLWLRQLGTSALDLARGAAPDGSGGVFVSGVTGGSLGGPSAGQNDAWLARYDGAGNQSWIRQIGTSGDDWAQAVALDGAGGVFVTGYTSDTLGGPSAGQNDIWLARYDGAGNQTWIRQFGTNNDDWTEAIALDGAGGVYVSGVTYGNLGGSNAGQNDAWLARFGSSGNVIWIRQFGTSAADLARGAAPDAAGGVYLCGVTYGDLGGSSSGGDDAWLVRYDSAGNQTWVRQFGSSAGDVAYDAASDGSGGVYLSGYTNGSLGGPNAGDFDAFVARYDSGGNQTWIRQFGSSGADLAYEVSTDGAGGVYVSGDTNGVIGGSTAGLSDAWIARFDGRLTSARYCTPAVPNSTGQSGLMSATGSNPVLANDVTLFASQIPHNSFGFFLASRTQGHVAGAGGSQGVLCLGGAIGRYVGLGQIRNSGTTGSFSLGIDLTTMPQPSGNVAVQPGETWNFQAWHRDANPTVTSNFTDALSVTFQ